MLQKVVGIKDIIHESLSLTKTEIKMHLQILQVHLLILGLSAFIFDILDIVGSGLVNEVVKPVGE